MGDGNLLLLSQELLTVWGNASYCIPRGGELGLSVCSVCRHRQHIQIIPSTNWFIIFRLKLLQHFPGHPHRPQSQTFNEGWKARELTRSWGEKACSWAADRAADRRVYRAERDYGGARWLGDPEVSSGGPVRAPRRRGGRRASTGGANVPEGSAATSGRPMGWAGVRHGFLTRSIGRH